MKRLALLLIAALLVTVYAVAQQPDIATTLRNERNLYLQTVPKPLPSAITKRAATAIANKFKLSGSATRLTAFRASHDVLADSYNAKVKDGSWTPALQADFERQLDALTLETIKLITDDNRTAKPVSISPSLTQATAIGPGESLVSGDILYGTGSDYLEMNADGSLCVEPGPVWCAGTSGTKITGTGNYATMLASGALTILSSTGVALWSANSVSPGGYILMESTSLQLFDELGDEVWYSTIGNTAGNYVTPLPVDGSYKNTYRTGWNYIFTYYVNMNSGKLIAYNAFIGTYKSMGMGPDCTVYYWPVLLLRALNW